MNRDYLIRPYKNEDKQAVIALYKQVFGEEAALKFERRFDWEFIDNPAKQKINCNNWVIDYKGIIVGHLGSLASIFKINKKEYPCLWAVDLMLDINHRKKGLADKLYEHFESAGVFAFFMLGLSVPTAKIAFKRGWRELKSDTVLIRILNLNGIKDFIFSKEKFDFSFSWLKLFAGVISAVFLNCFKFKRQMRDVNTAEVFPVLKFDERFDEFFQAISCRYPVMFLRDKHILNWRLISNPNYKNDIFAAERNGKILGFIAAAIEKFHNINIGYIIDFLTLPEEKTAAEALIEKAVVNLKSQGADLILSVGLSKYQRGILRRNDFLANGLIQRHLRPGFFFKMRGENTERELLNTPENWFVSNFNYDLFM